MSWQFSIVAQRFTPCGEIALTHAERSGFRHESKYNSNSVRRRS